MRTISQELAAITEAMTIITEAIEMILLEDGDDGLPSVAKLEGSFEVLRNHYDMLDELTVLRHRPYIAALTCACAA